MDDTVLVVFLISTLIGGVTTGLAGFAMGLVVSGVWLHILTPAQTAALIVGYGLIAQSYGIWVLRHALDWRAVMPFIISGAVGVPIGTVLLAYIEPGAIRIGVGALLVAYSSYFLLRPHVHAVKATLPLELGVGFFNGVLGGMTGLSGPIITVWCQLHGWNKDEQRAIYQPVIFAAFVMSAISLGAAGTFTLSLIKIYLYGLPALFVGFWIGIILYGRLDDAAFRKVILLLLLLSGLVLIVPFSIFT